MRTFARRDSFKRHFGVKKDEGTYLGGKCWVEGKLEGIPENEWASKWLFEPVVVRYVLFPISPGSDAECNVKIPGCGSEIQKRRTTRHGYISGHRRRGSHAHEYDYDYEYEHASIPIPMNYRM